MRHPLCKNIPGKFVIGIDARQGKLAVKGCKETTAKDAVELAQRCEQDGASRINYLDISRDGTRDGVNLDEALQIARAARIPIVAVARFMQPEVNHSALYKSSNGEGFISIAGVRSGSCRYWGLV